MATIKRFEDLEAWKISREVTKEIYRVSKNDLFIRDTVYATRFVEHRFRLCQILQKDLNAMGIKSLLISCQLPKARRAKLVPNCMSHSTRIIFLNLSSSLSMKKQTETAK